MNRDDATLVLLMISAIGALNLMPSLDSISREPEQKASEQTAASFQSHAVIVAALTGFTVYATKSAIPLVLGGAILFATWRNYQEAVYAS